MFLSNNNAFSWGIYAFRSRYGRSTIGQQNINNTNAAHQSKTTESENGPGRDGNGFLINFPLLRFSAHSLSYKSGARPAEQPQPLLWRCLLKWPLTDWPPTVKMRRPKQELKSYCYLYLRCDDHDDALVTAGKNFGDRKKRCAICWTQTNGCVNFMLTTGLVNILLILIFIFICYTLK